MSLESLSHGTHDSNGVQQHLTSRISSAGGVYRWYVLAILVLVNMINQVDRQILSFLAPFVRSDLHLTDAQLGLLYGTAFALFYGVFGVPLSSLADSWHRVRTLWIGLLFWSSMTALSGCARNFTELSLARVGVGLGEASASPAAISLLGDYFEKQRRSTILAFYFVGTFLGIGLSLILGGAIVSAWHAAFGEEPGLFGLRAWQATFVVIGLPGILLAAIVALTIREPGVGELEGIRTERPTRPFRAVFGEIGALIPPWSVIAIARLGGRKSATWSALIAVVVALLVVWTIHFTDGLLPPARRPPVGMIGTFIVTTNVVQWVAIGIASYAIVCWAQMVRLRDRVTYSLTVGSRTYMLLVTCSALMGICQAAHYAFNFLYATRYLGFDSKSGLLLGAIAATFGVLGVSLGGLVGDAVRKRFPSGRVYVSMIAFALVGLVGFVEYTTDDRRTFLIAYMIQNICLTFWMGPLQATSQDILLPRMRGIGFALKSLGASVVGLGLGPYVVGLISDLTGDLRFAILLSLLSLVPAIACLCLVARRLPRTEATLLERARRAGEVV